MEKQVLVFVLAIVFAGVAAQWIAWRLRMPGIVVLLAAGLLLGPVTGLLDPSRDFGAALRPAVGLAVAIIVFEGGLKLNLQELRSAGSGVLRLTVLALPLNWLFGALAGHVFGGFDWPVAALFGAILVVTGPTVILPLLRQAKLQRRPASFLKWEAVVNDPIGALLAVLVLEFLAASARQGGGEAAAGLAWQSGAGLVVAVALGFGAALLLRWAFHRDQVPEMLRAPLLLGMVLAIAATSNAIQREAGLLAATVFGLALSNLGITGIAALSRFKEALTVLLVSGLFILLTADLDPRLVGSLSWRIAALTAAMLFLARPAAILLATMGSDMTLRERLLVALIAPRGIVAAAMAGISGLTLAQAGYRDADLILPSVFSVIAVSVVLHGFALGPLARRLGLTAADRPGLLIAGASPWSIELAVLLKELKVPVVLADSSWASLRPARRLGLTTVSVELLSEAVDDILDPAPIDYVFAATGDDAYNALLCARLAPELGRERVHQLALGSGRLDAHRTPSREWRGKIVGARDLTFQTLSDWHDQGWRFVAHAVPPEAEGQELRDGAPDRHPLLIIAPNGEISFFSPERSVILRRNETVVSVAKADRASL